MAPMDIKTFPAICPLEKEKEEQLLKELLAKHPGVMDEN